MVSTTSGKADAFWQQTIAQPFSSAGEGRDRQEGARKHLRKLPADLSPTIAAKLFAFYLEQAAYDLWPATATIPFALVDVLVDALRANGALQARMLVAAFDAGGADALREVGALFLHVSRNLTPESLMKRAGLFRPTRTFAAAAADIVLAEREQPIVTENGHYWVLVWVASHARPEIFDELETRAAQWAYSGLLFKLARKLPRQLPAP